MKITTFAEIAAWKKTDMDKVNEQLKFKGRIEREEWVPQAKLLAAGKEAAFEKKYGTGGMKNAAGKRSRAPEHENSHTARNSRSNLRTLNLQHYGWSL